MRATVVRTLRRHQTALKGGLKPREWRALKRAWSRMTRAERAATRKRMVEFVKKLTGELGK